MQASRSGYVPVADDGGDRHDPDRAAADGLPDSNGPPRGGFWNPLRRVSRTSSASAGARVPFPPGPTDFDLARARRIAHDPLPILLPLYERHGPIFSVRLLHARVVFMLGPEANHYITVSHPENFHWREGSFGDLIPLLGDGLLTIDGDYHDRARRIMMPAFHREQIEAAVEAMVAEAEPRARAAAPGEVVDVYEWMRNLAMRIAMRALLGLDPDDGGRGERRRRALRARARLLRHRLPPAAAARAAARRGGG